MEKEEIKILQFCDNYYPQIDGVIKVVDNSSKIMNEWGTVKVVVPKYRKNFYDDSNFPYDVLRKKTNSIHFNGIEIPLPKSTKRLTHLIKKYNADIYHIHSPFFIGRYALRLAKKNKVPVIGTFHSQFKKDILSVTNNEKLANILIKVIVKTFEQCTEVWAPSKSTADVLRSYGYKKEIYIMENGTDFIYPNNIDLIIDNVTAKYNIQKENKNLLFVGQIREVKNISLILETLKLLVKEDDSYFLYLVGEGPDRTKYEKWIKENYLENNVCFVGKIEDRNILAGIYAACDLFFFPSTYDNAPIVVREACVMKTPVLLPKDSVASEPFIDEKNGYLEEESAFKMKNKINNIFSNRSKMKKIGEQASKDIPITYENMVKNTLNRYKYIIKKYEEENNEK